MRVAVLQHVPFEGPAALVRWAAERDYQLVVYPLFERPKLPTLEDFDLLVVLGGPMSVHDTKLDPWLAPERELI